MSEQDIRERLWKVIQETRFALFTSRHVNGHLHARPVATLNAPLDEDPSLWFLMAREGEPVCDFDAEPSVNVAYVDPARGRCVSVSGLASVVDDPEKRKELESRTTQAGFTGGVDDPDLVLVRVRITHADDWDVQANQPTTLLRRAGSSEATGAAERP